MGIAKVAIIGRPNVGKSSLFNWLAGERISIVDSVAGVTRDRVSFLLDLGPVENKKARQNNEKTKGSAITVSPSEQVSGEQDDQALVEQTLESRLVELTDTGGIGIVDKDDLSDDVEQQIQLAISTSDAILFVVDAIDGIAPLDEHVAERLRTLSLPVLLVANKADNDLQQRNAEEFHRFGWGVIPVSAKQKRGRVHLMSELESILPNELFTRMTDDQTDPVLKMAIVGRRNVGKSTFVNTLAKEERVIASPIPGTTRDSIDVRFEMDGKTFVAIDTPGFMRRKSISTDLDFYSIARARRSIRMADVVLMFFDCSQQISKMDMQLVGLIEESGRPCLFVVNKWDLMVQHMPTSRWGDYLRETFPNLWYVPIAFITGMTGKNADKLLQHVQILLKQSRMRIPTNRLNRLITAAMNYNPPPLFHFRKPKVYYVTQVEVSPPTIVLFCNMPDAFSPPYRRFLLNVLRDELPIGEVPIRVIFRKRESDDSRDEIEPNRKN